VSRLAILTEEEQREFDYPPILSVEARALSFAIDDRLQKRINKLHTPTNKVGFLLQYAYFKACKRFFLINRFRQGDVEYATKLLGIPLQKIKLHQYKERVPKCHEATILTIFDSHSFNSQKAWLEKEIKIRVERVLDPRTLFFELLHLLHQHNVQVPSYNTLTELITEHYNSHEEFLLSIIESTLNEEHKKALRALLQTTKNKSGSILNNYKYINQSGKIKALQASITVFNEIQEIVGSSGIKGVCSNGRNPLCLAELCVAIAV